MDDVVIRIKDIIRDSAVEDLLKVIENLTINIDKYYISRKEHERIVKEMKGK